MRYLLILLFYLPAFSVLVQDLDWDHVLTDGGEITDAKRDDFGNIYLTGNYGDHLYLNGQKMLVDKGPGGFLAKFSPDGKLFWIKGIVRDIWVTNHLSIDENQNPAICFYSTRISSPDFRLSLTQA